MTAAVTTAAVTVAPLVVEDYVGPCGCFACEKWSDCDYCGSCAPEQEFEWLKAEAEYWVEYEENMRRCT